MARARDRNHPLADQVKDAAKEGERRQGEDKAEAREATQEGRTGSERDLDVKSEAVAEEQPSDERTRQAQAQVDEQQVPTPTSAAAGRDILDDPDDPLDDPRATRLTRNPDQGVGIDDPSMAVARLPDRIAEHHERVLAAMQDTSGGAPFADRGEDQISARETPIDTEAEFTPSAGRNVEEEPVTLLRDADVAGDAGMVHLDRRFQMDPDAPKGGEEGGAKLAEPDTRKKNPGAPWPGPEESLAAAPTPSPEPGPEPTVQLEPPQEGIRWEHKPEAAVGLIGAGAADRELQRAAERSEVEAFQAQRTGGKGAQTTAAMIRDQRLAARAQGEELRNAQERDRGPRGSTEDDGHPRDEAGQISLEHLTDAALKAVGEIFRGSLDNPEPYRVRIALEHAARRVMSPQWWDIHEKHFAKPAE